MLTGKEYELDPTLLLHIFAATAIQAAASRRRDTDSSWQHQDDEKFLHGVVLARIDGVKPPMHQSDEVWPKSWADRTNKVPFIVKRIYYVNKIWKVSFTNDVSVGRWYNADEFYLALPDPH